MLKNEDIVAFYKKGHEEYRKKYMLPLIYLIGREDLADRLINCTCISLIPKIEAFRTILCWSVVGNLAERRIKRKRASHEAHPAGL
jgi:hypothetical protein